MKLKSVAVVAASLVAITSLSACSGPGAASGTSAASGTGADSVNVVGFSVLEAANKPVFDEFDQTDQGKGVRFSTSYGASGDQSRAVEGGLKADLVHFSLEPDIQRLVDAKLVDANWKSNATKGIATSSVVSFVVREGNPKKIEGWDDLIKPGVEIITPNPASSGSAKWNILGAYGHILAQGGSDAEASAFVKKILEHTIALPGSGREATTAFGAGNGDVLISYENEAILARQNGEPFDYVVPQDTLLIENPAAVTTKASTQAKDLLAFLTTPEAQAEYAHFGFRPVIDGVTLDDIQGANDPANPFPKPKTLLTIDQDFGGWAAANKRFFDETDGIITKLQAETGKTS